MSNNIFWVVWVVVFRIRDCRGVNRTSKQVLIAEPPRCSWWHSQRQTHLESYPACWPHPPPGSIVL